MEKGIGNVVADLALPRYQEISAEVRRVKRNWFRLHLGSSAIKRGASGKLRLKQIANQPNLSTQDVAFQQPHLVNRRLRVCNLDPNAVHCRVNVLRHKTFHRWRCSQRRAVGEYNVVSILSRGERGRRQRARHKQVEVCCPDLRRRTPLGGSGASR